MFIMDLSRFTVTFEGNHLTRAAAIKQGTTEVYDSRGTGLPTRQGLPRHQTRSLPCLHEVPGHGKQVGQAYGASAVDIRVRLKVCVLLFPNHRHKQSED